MAMALVFLTDVAGAAEPSAPTLFRDLFSDENESLAIDLIPFELEPSALKLFDLTTAEQNALRHPVALDTYLAEPARRPQFETSAVLHPTATTIAAGELFRMNAPTKDTLLWWSYQVIDSRGRAIKEQRGEKSAPPDFSWDGAEEGWLKIRTGEPYNVVFTAQTQAGKALRTVGEPRSYSALAWENGTRSNFHFSSDKLFRGSDSVLTQEGQGELLAACERMAKNPGEPVSVDVFSKNATRAQKQRERVLTFLSDTLYKNHDAIESDVQIDPDEGEEVRIHILGEQE